MGKYKQWLHHQEVGRRLREQIATHEQERERVQRMAPSHPTTLPDTNNPLVRALLDYTGRGGTLGRAVSGRIAGSPTGGGDADPQLRQPEGYASAPKTAQPTAPITSSGASPFQASATPAASADPLVAQLAAQAAQTPADPLAAMQALAQAQARDTQPQAAVKSADQPAETATAPEGNTAGDWWQSFRANR
jgi:hypothetical protein